MSQSKGSTVFCKLQLHALSKKTVPKISHNPRLNLTIFLGNWPCWFFKIKNCINLQVEKYLQNVAGFISVELDRFRLETIIDTEGL